SVIHPGMKLQVPPGGVVPQAPAAPAANSNQTPPASSQALTYTVVSGDSLIGIASRAKVSLNNLLTTNKLTVNSLIYPGMRLTIPAGGVVPSAPQAAPAPSAPSGGAVSGGGSSSTNPQIAAVLDFALAQQGKPYAFNTAGPNTYDCSGLTLAAYQQIGIRLPHYSGYQARYGVAVDWTASTIQPGDLVFLESYPGSGVINHVGIAINSTQYIHAPRSGDVVRVGNIPMHRVVSVRRLVTG
ncbi:MAG TPA: hypothetical protein DCR14_07165, partial [Acidimicrobiaceae bacterium]|nr:hypothetical protein [Acidimicrobiaceae bacterium]